MDPTVITAAIGLAGTCLAAIGGGIWHAACWFAKRCDTLIDNHMELTKKLTAEMEWKHSKLEAVHDDIKEIHQVTVPPISERPSKSRIKQPKED